MGGEGFEPVLTRIKSPVRGHYASLPLQFHLRLFAARRNAFSLRPCAPAFLNILRY